MAEQTGPEPLDGRLAGAFRWQLRVLDSTQVTPTVLRLRLTSERLDLLAPKPGQDLMFAVPTAEGTINRRYTIRAYEPGGAEPHVAVDVVIHGDGPGSRWVAAVEPGEVVTAVGPRGQIWPDDAGRQVFVGDSSGCPAVLTMLESLPPGVEGAAVVRVATADERQPTSVPDQVTWLVGADDAAFDTAVLAAAAGADRVYLTGERADVARQRSALVDAGLATEAVTVKPYWARASANAANGEPPKG